MMNPRDYLLCCHIDYMNNYLTRAKYGEHNGLTEQEAIALLDLAKTVASHPHPES